jgi:2,4-dienoyl-CoA reductase-like NADH-dependent reductase (Old Yellow Enzyme family)
MSILFSPATIGNFEVRNRLVHSATYEAMAGENGEVTEQLLKRYINLAKGQTGLIIPGHMYVLKSGRAHSHQTGIHTDDMIPGLTKLASAVHEHGARILFQITHAGRQTTKDAAGQKPIAPSSFDRDPINFVKPREMTTEDILGVARAYGRAASRAIQAGADGIQIHAAHGYMVNQFLSPFFNRRSDAWGGSPENRFRFVEEIYGEIQKSVPDSTPVLIKLNTNDHTPTGGVTPELAKEYAKRLVQLGITGIEISSGSAHYSLMNVCRGKVPVEELCAELPFWKRPIARMMLKKMVGKYDLVEGYHLDAARIIKPILGGVPLMLVAGMRRMIHMEEILQSGDADFISMSRPLIREPFLAKRFMEGKSDRVACVSCNKCFAAIVSGRPLKCLHRPDSH